MTNIEDKTFIKVRGYHIDLYNHVNNARYLEFYEAGRWDYLEPRIDFNVFVKNKWNFVVVNINIDYKRGAVLGDTLQVHTYLTHIGRKSMRFEQKITLKDTDTLISRADINYVIVDANSGKALETEGAIDAVFRPLLVQ